MIAPLYPFGDEPQTLAEIIKGFHGHLEFDDHPPAGFEAAVILLDFGGGGLELLRLLARAIARLAEQGHRVDNEFFLQDNETVEEALAPDDPWMLFVELRWQPPVTAATLARVMSELIDADIRLATENG